MMEQEMKQEEGSFPSHANAVVIGLGIAGACVLWELKKRGVTDIVAVDRGPLPETGGSTSHTSEINSIVNANRLECLRRIYGQQVFSQFDCMKTVGGLEFASNKERWEDLKRRHFLSKSWGLETHLLSPNEAKEKFPHLKQESINGALWVPTAGISDSLGCVRKMIDDVQGAGAGSVWPWTDVTEVDVRDGRVRGVYTNKGYIKTDVVIACGGVWAPLIGNMARVTKPLYPVEHYNITLGPFPEFQGQRGVNFPVFRDQGRGVYGRQYGEDWEFGYYGTTPIELFSPDRIRRYEDVKLGNSPTLWMVNKLDAAHYFQWCLDGARELFSFMDNEDLQVVHARDGLIAMTVDENPLLGESPDVRGFYSAQRVWVNEAPGLAKMVAELIVDGYTEWESSEVAMSRFHPHQLVDKHIRNRIYERTGQVYTIRHPKEPSESEHNVRLSPFFEQQRKLEAVFFETAGWERPGWYEANKGLLKEYDVPRRKRGSWEAGWHSPIIGVEHLHSRAHVGMWDLTSFMKFDVFGPGALDYTQKMVVSQMDVSEGRAVVTAVLDERGGIKADITVHRLGPNYFRVITGGGGGMNDLAWFRRHLPEDDSVYIQDVTDSMAVIGLWGPNAGDVLRSVTDDDLSFHHMTMREIAVGSVPVRALQMSFVGESGWELYIPTGYGVNVWNTLWEAGQEHRLIACGISTYASSMRLEKGYHIWGPTGELNTEHTLFEAGMLRDRPTYGDRASMVKREYFIGKEAVLRQREELPARRLCTMLLENPGRVFMGGEPILDPDIGKVLTDRNGNPSYVTSADNAYSLGEVGQNIVIVMGYIPEAYAYATNEVDIEYFGKRYRAVIQ